MFKEILVKVLTLYALVLGCQSCFELSELPDNVTKEVDLPTIKTIDFFSGSGSNLMSDVVILNIALSESRPIYWYELLLDSISLISENGNPKNFFFNTNEFDNGSHLLRLNIYYKTNSGTIADQLNSEAIIVTYYRNILIYNAPINSADTLLSSNPTHLGFSNVDGELVMKIDPYADEIGFESWAITNENGVPIVKYFDAGLEELVVPGYYGQPIKIYLQLNAKNKTKTSELITYEWDYNFQIDAYSENIFVAWNKPDFNNYQKMEVYYQSGQTQLNYGESSVILPKPVLFPFSTGLSFYALSNDKKEAYIRNVWARTDRIEFPSGVSDYFTFRNDSVISIFSNDQTSFSYGKYFVSNYRIIKTPFNKYDSLVLLNQNSPVVFSRDYNQIARIGSTSVSFLDTMTLQPISTYQYSTLVSPSDVTQVYLSGEDRIGLLHNNNESVSIYNLSTSMVEEVYSYSCVNEFGIGSSYDLNKYNLFVSKPYFELSTYMKEDLGNLACMEYDENTNKVIWFEEGQGLSLVKEGDPFNTISTRLQVQDLSGIILDSRDVPETYYKNLAIFKNQAYVVSNDGWLQIYDLNNGLNQMNRIYVSESFPSIYAVSPQLKRGRISILIYGILHYYNYPESI